MAANLFLGKHRDDRRQIGRDCIAKYHGVQALRHSLYRDQSLKEPDGGISPGHPDQ
jgi:hypothetical protein